MSDVAAEAGVSRALVSIVFRDMPGASPASRDRVREAARRIGYRPNTAARQLARSAARTIGVLMTLRNPFHADIVEHLYTAAEPLGLDLMLATVGQMRDTDTGLATLAGYPCAGYVLLGPTCPVEDIAELDRISPAVVVGERAAEGTVDVVRSDDEAGVRLALDHLYALGHRRIAHIGGAAGASMKARVDTYLDWMAHHCPKERPDLLPGEDTEEGGLTAAHQLASRKNPGARVSGGQRSPGADASTSPEDLPTAVLAANDRCAIGLLRGLGERGIDVPARVCLIGFDDTDIGQFGGLSLTTVHQDAAALAEVAMDYLADRVAGADTPPRLSVFTPVLRVRATTGPVPR
jgi:DNA-binding LacI/PurR family transcriptional regulator